jgi:hypothetical protein
MRSRELVVRVMCFCLLLLTVALPECALRLCSLNCRFIDKNIVFLASAFA